MRRLIFLGVVLVLVLTSCIISSAEEWEKYDKPVPTRVIVRVLAHGAKAMNEHTGVLVVIRDARTGKELDKGPAEGSTGDDIAIMRAGYPRNIGKSGLLKGEKGMIFEDQKSEDKMKAKGWMEPDPYVDMRDDRKPEEMKPSIYEAKVDTAYFETVLNITKPTQIIVEAYGPLMPKHAMANAITSSWIFPGEDVTGEGIVLELRGVIVDVQDSLREKEIGYDEAKGGITVPFYMRMMCGCPITPNGMMGIAWEAEGFKITTQAYYKGKLYYEDVTPSNKILEGVSRFSTNVPLPKEMGQGTYAKERIKVRVMSAQSDQNNFGMDEFNIYVTKTK